MSAEGVAGVGGHALKYAYVAFDESVEREGEVGEDEDEDKTSSPPQTLPSTHTLVCDAVDISKGDVKAGEGGAESRVGERGEGFESG